MDTIRVSVAKHSAILITRVFVCESSGIVKTRNKDRISKRKGCPTERKRKKRAGTVWVWTKQSVWAMRRRRQWSMERERKKPFFLTFQMSPGVILVNCSVSLCLATMLIYIGALVTKANGSAALAGLTGSAWHYGDLGHFPSLPPTHSQIPDPQEGTLR